MEFVYGIGICIHRQMIILSLLYYVKSSKTAWILMNARMSRSQIEPRSSAACLYELCAKTRHTTATICARAAAARYLWLWARRIRSLNARVCDVYNRFFIRENLSISAVHLVIGFKTTNLAIPFFFIICTRTRYTRASHSSLYSLIL